MNRQTISTLLPGLDTAEMPLAEYGEREEFHIENIIAQATSLVSNALKHGDASTDRLIEAIGALDPAYLHHPDFTIPSQVNFRAALELLNDLTPAILLPHGQFVVVNVVGREMEIFRGKVVDKEFLVIPYLDGQFQIKFAEARFYDVTPDKHRQSISGFLLLDSEMAALDAYTIVQLAANPIVQRGLPVISTIPTLQGKYSISDQEYCEIAGTNRAFFAGLAALQDRVYANAFDGKLEVLSNLDARIAARLVKPNSTLRTAIDAGLKSREDEFAAFPEISASIALSGALSGLIQELDVYIARQSWERGHLAVVDYYITNKMISRVSAENETFHYKAQIAAAKWLAKEINNILDGDAGISRRILDARPKLAVERFRDCVQAIFSKNFYTLDDRRAVLGQMLG